MLLTVRQTTDRGNNSLLGWGNPKPKIGGYNCKEHGWIYFEQQGSGTAVYPSTNSSLKTDKRRWKMKRSMDKKERCKYFESSFGHFGVFVVKLHPLLDDAADAGLWVVDKLKASDVRPTFPQVC